MSSQSMLQTFAAASGAVARYQNSPGASKGKWVTKCAVYTRTMADLSVTKRDALLPTWMDSRVTALSSNNQNTQQTKTNGVVILIHLSFSKPSTSGGTAGQWMVYKGMPGRRSGKWQSHSSRTLLGMIVPWV